MKHDDEADKFPPPVSTALLDAQFSLIKFLDITLCRDPPRHHDFVIDYHRRREHYAVLLPLV